MSKKEIENLVSVMKAGLSKKSLTVLTDLKLNDGVPNPTLLFGEPNDDGLHFSWEDSNEILFTAIKTIPSKNIRVNMHTNPAPHESSRYHKIGTFDFWNSNVSGRIYLLSEQVGRNHAGEISLTNYVISNEPERKQFSEITRGWKEGIELYALTIEKIIVNKESFIKEHFNFQ